GFSQTLMAFSPAIEQPVAQFVAIVGIAQMRPLRLRHQGCDLLAPTDSIGPGEARTFRRGSVFQAAENLPRNLSLLEASARGSALRNRIAKLPILEARRLGLLAEPHPRDGRRCRLPQQFNVRREAE